MHLLHPFLTKHQILSYIQYKKKVLQGIDGVYLIENRITKKIISTFYKWGICLSRKSNLHAI